MPKITPPPESLEGRKPNAAGVYMVRLDGFKPRKSKSGDSVNLYPTLKIINHPTANDNNVFENLNSSAGWVLKDFVHAFGLPMDNGSLPGDFQGPDDDPTKWTYVGPLKGRTAKLEVAMKDNTKGGMIDAVKRYFCAVPGCQEKHSESLI